MGWRSRVEPLSGALALVPPTPPDTWTIRALSYAMTTPKDLLSMYEHIEQGTQKGRRECCVCEVSLLMLILIIV